MDGKNGKNRKNGNLEYFRDLRDSRNFVYLYLWGFQRLVGLFREAAGGRERYGYGCGFGWGEVR